MRLAESSDCLGGERSQLDTLEMVSGIHHFWKFQKENVSPHTAKPSPEKWRSKSRCSGSKGSSWNIRNASMLSSPVTSETVWLPPPHLWWAEEHFCLACGVFSPRHRTLVSLSTYIIFFTHTSAYCPTPSTFNHIKSPPPPPLQIWLCLHSCISSCQDTLCPPYLWDI